MRISDWSSDVCSSDLVPHAGSIGVAPTLPLPIPHSSPSGLTRGSRAGDEAVALDARVKPELSRLRYSMHLTASGDSGCQARGPCAEIGRASCRERVCQYV